MNDVMPENFGRYQVVKLLGKGGMAVVYHARDPRLDRDVAVKVILPDQQKETTFLKRFEREARVLAKLTHPNIVPITDYGEQDGLPYLVMPYLPGGSLKESLHAALPAAEAARVLAPIARALHAAHQEGIIHRDIKPSNMLLTRTGEVMLTDFGIARLLQGEQPSDLTASGTSLGTPDYMSPEQVQGHPVGARSDIYSLGAVLYEMVTGRKPFEADTPLSMALKRVTETLPPPRTYRPDLPVEVEQVITRALEKSPDDRYPNMAAFAAALEKLQHTTAPTTPIAAVASVGSPSPETLAVFGNHPDSGKTPPDSPGSATGADENNDIKKTGLLAGKRKWLVIIPIILFICLITLICLGTISENKKTEQTASAAVTEDMEAVSIDLATRLSNALTTTPDILSIRQSYELTPTPSMERMEECLHWDEITIDLVGDILCVSGEVVTSYSTERSDIITFSNNPDDFFLISFHGEMTPGPGSCVLARGVVRQLGTPPMMIVMPGNMAECPVSTDE
jgi:serine/threonine protein kinase